MTEILKSPGMKAFGLEVLDASDEARAAAEQKLTEKLLSLHLKPSDYYFRRVKAWDAKECRVILRVDAMPIVDKVGCC